jgi:hypothetical protein
MRDLSKPLAPTFGDPKPKKQKRRVVTKTPSSSTSHKVKEVVVTRKDGTLKKKKFIVRRDSNRKNVVAGEKGKGRAPSYKLTTKYDKSGTYKKQKTVYTKGKYDTREAKGAGGRVIGGSVKSKREVIRGKNPDA